jgi:hypothetical protein
LLERIHMALTTPMLTVGSVLLKSEAAYDSSLGYRRTAIRCGLAN